jgi:glycerol-3-phosphate dehydrogenase (NAD(P)+)
MANVAIAGAGMMGAATAYPLSDNGHTVRPVGTHLDDDIIRSRLETRYHPTLKRELPAGVQPFFVEEMAQALDGANVIVGGTVILG